MPAPTEKILLVDDEPRLLAGLKRNLGLSFSVLTAEGAAAALDVIAQNEDIAVIVSDMQMPEMNGVDLLKEVKIRTPHIRRMMLTGNSDQDTAIAAVNEGAVMRFLRKPCDPDTLKDAINYALDDFRFSTLQNDEAEKSAAGNIARDSFLSMMNHEIRTPLNHIIGLAQLIDIPESESSEQSKTFLGTLQNSADHLLQTLARILDYSRISTLDGKLTGRPFDFVDLLKDEVDRAKERGAQNQITVAFDSPYRVAEFIGCEEDIRLAIREILANAIDFNKLSGHVGVTLRNNTDAVDVKISDTGIGIPEEHLSRVTGAFTQADEGDQREHGGIGLGLSLASAIAEANRGGMSITSTEGKGTTVVLTFAQANAAAGNTNAA